MEEYKLAGSVFRIYQWHFKQELNESGEKPVIIYKEPEVKKKRIN
tara:strand:+ start:10587 stop:10721 length:135 start_codon:yes stop_codon:yes gene_type:complete